MLCRLGDVVPTTGAGFEFPRQCRGSSISAAHWWGCAAGLGSSPSHIPTAMTSDA